VFSNARRVLSQCDTRLRLLYLLNIFQSLELDLNCFGVVFISHFIGAKLYVSSGFHFSVYLFHGNANCLVYQTLIYFQVLDACKFLIDSMKERLVTPE